MNRSGPGVDVMLENGTGSPPSLPWVMRGLLVGGAGAEIPLAKVVCTSTSVLWAWPPLSGGKTNCCACLLQAVGVIPLSCFNDILPEIDETPLELLVTHAFGPAIQPDRSGSD